MILSAVRAKRAWLIFLGIAISKLLKQVNIKDTTGAQVNGIENQSVKLDK